MSDRPHQFWIDVGGTFTDCLCLRPDGSLARSKVLSSGVVKGAAAASCDRRTVIDPARAADPPGFWVGYRCNLLDASGRQVDTATIERFDAGEGRLALDRELAVVPVAGQPYELASGEDAPLMAIRRLLGLPLSAAIPPVVVRLGTTRGTNALLTRGGAPTALVTTRGFGDILGIGYQNRPKLFERTIHKPEPLFQEVIDIGERVAADGRVLESPRPDEIRRLLAAAQQRGIQSLAICLLHGYAHPAHERLVETIARELGFQFTSTSHRVAPLIKIVSRGDTTVMDAYLNPVLQAYVARLQRALGSGELRIMTSSGGLVAAEQFAGKDSVLSGPAGGVVGFSRVARSAGFARAIGFDMGGTST
ncbi:MAG TPA: hydantoinase/oxoprolinase N-terminal domain-containing protein, partial [Pirellulales bacterium]|nr:hydantoinase/oxoprolinase N-terminal domain-containing protein [Pirellulales bacterium]